MQSKRSTRASYRRSKATPHPNEHGDYIVEDLDGQEVSTRALAMRIARHENVQMAASIVLITYDDGAVRPLVCLLFDTLATDTEVSELVAGGLWDVIDKARSYCREARGSV